MSIKRCHENKTCLIDNNTKKSKLEIPDSNSTYTNILFETLDNVLITELIQMVNDYFKFSFTDFLVKQGYEDTKKQNIIIGLVGRIFFSNTDQWEIAPLFTGPGGKSFIQYLKIKYPNANILAFDKIIAENDLATLQTMISPLSYHESQKNIINFPIFYQFKVLPKLEDDNILRTIKRRILQIDLPESLDFDRCFQEEIKIEYYKLLGFCPYDSDPWNYLHSFHPITPHNEYIILKRDIYMQ